MSVRIFLVALITLVVLVPGITNAKRGEPAKVEPVFDAGVRYVAPNDDGRQGYIQARDEKSDKLVWSLTIYRNVINPLLEEDVQWVFIKKLSLSNGELVVVDERGRRYSVDLKTRAVTKLK